MTTQTPPGIDPTSSFVSFTATRSRRSLETALSVAVPILFADARRLRLDEHDAADLVQETILTAIERRYRFDPSLEFVPWLRGILRNHARAHRRQRARWIALCASSDPRCEENEPQHTYELRQAGLQLRAAVEELPERYRQVMRLYLDGETSPNEMAAKLGRSASTIRSQLERGLQRLRRRVPVLAWAVVLAATATDGLRAQSVAASMASCVGRRRNYLFGVAAFTVVAIAVYRAGPDGVFASETVVRSAPISNDEPAALPVVELPGSEERIRASARTGSVRVAVDLGGADQRGIRVIARRLRPQADWLDRLIDTPRIEVVDDSGGVVFSDLSPGKIGLSLDDGRLLREVDVVAGRREVVRCSGIERLPQRASCATRTGTP